MQTSKDDVAADPPCHSKANSYNEAKCKSQVDALYACCNKFYERNGHDATSASCPKANLLWLKMKQRAEEEGKEKAGSGR
ncbi:hypothetical protein MBM_08598 [Drepanopeziza brunnea f. sp. 'multigermtubi' MB_m1]|uniref:Cx9C motif-containing protein 4, mitochondrial n=1 Tax=Marssonina brunnea f. sp. multigermtubi (strain MB_m1) TaxID=1072389 RepID=K1W7T6_MARBU|nr:uncharacterized protein MBM_08598 [Drepanopeziza brunnea f. sp. 'multigermtubi' MB_m1]EKD13155.1 hypothetical protein MBM_08598 [Drepanopeziza brunnea f. sp. 'multigermtubi' MB_m1]